MGNAAASRAGTDAGPTSPSCRMIRTTGILGSYTQRVNDISTTPSSLNFCAVLFGKTLLLCVNDQVHVYVTFWHVKFEEGPMPAFAQATTTGILP